MDNPFRYGIAVDEPYFIDREQELKDYSVWLKSGQSLVIYSPRRYGKTSLMLKLLNKLHEDGYNTIYVDFFRINSRRRFAELYYAEIIKQMPTWEKALRKISTLTKKIRPVVSLDNQGIPNVTIRFEDNSRDEDLTELFDLPQKLAVRQPWIVVFDEFQEVEKLNGENFEKELRSCAIHHDKVSYVFMGSKTNMLLNMFTNRNRAFYQFGKITELRKISSEILSEYIESGFKNTGIRFHSGIAVRIIEKSEAIPHYVQYLASACWEEAREGDAIIDDILVDSAVDKIILNQNDYFMKQYEDLTAHQQRVLVAVSRENKNLFTAEFADKFHLSPVSSTQRSVQRLLKTGILSKNGDTYDFNDPFFRLWISKHLI